MFAEHYLKDILLGNRHAEHLLSKQHFVTLAWMQLGILQVPDQW